MRKIRVGWPRGTREPEAIGILMIDDQSSWNVACQSQSSRPQTRTKDGSHGIRRMAPGIFGGEGEGDMEGNMEDGSWTLAG